MKRAAQNKHDKALAEHVEWEWHFTQLAEFVRRHGHADLGPHPVTDWLQRQCHAKRLKTLSSSRQKRLRDLGIDLDQDLPLPAEEPDDEKRTRRGQDPKKIALWEKRYSELRAYQAEHGHTNVLKSQNRILGRWRDAQREFRRNGTIKPERIARLDAIGFEWEAPGREDRTQAEWHQHRWDVMFQRLVAFKDRFGHYHVPTKWEEDTQLAAWASAQRKLSCKGLLLAARRQRFDEFGFLWDQPAPFDRPPFKVSPSTPQIHLALWETRYAEMCAYQAEHGHTNVTNRQNLSLGVWREVQRTQRRKGKLSPERIARLEAIGFEWEAPGLNGQKQGEVLRGLWERRFTELVAYHLRFGHVEVPRRWPESPALADWVHNQRALNYRKRLNPERFRRLDALGFAWTTQNTSLTTLWETRYAELCAYQAQHGHTNVTKSQNRVLGHWRDVQREFRRKGMLSAERIARLDAIGFEWKAPGRRGLTQHDYLRQKWDEHLASLAAFKERFGHAQVPDKWAENRSLATWVTVQRKGHRTGKLPAERRQQLDDLGFVWHPDSRFNLPPFPQNRAPAPKKTALWETRYAELCAYRAQHGHTNVTKSQNRILGRWRDAQREFRRNGTIKPERIARLDAIGFEWAGSGEHGRRKKNRVRVEWSERLADLRAFKKRFGHTQVPAHWEGDSSLSDWVVSQRKAHRKGRITADRYERLEALGFEWSPTRRSIRSHSGKPRTIPVT